MLAEPCDCVATPHDSGGSGDHSNVTVRYSISGALGPSIRSTRHAVHAVRVGEDT